jgi:CMP/dCMP kinase
MEKKHIITISGKPGSGKSSTADKVAELLGYTRYSSGDFVRSIIRQHKLTLAEFNLRAETDHSIDHEIDDELRKLRDLNDIVVDSRLGFYWIPESFKVYLDLDMDVATARIFKDMVDNSKRSSTESATTIAEAQDIVFARVESEQERFRKLYGINPYTMRHYDLVINTSRHSPQSVALTIFDTYQKWLHSETWTQVVNKVPLGYSLQ